ncbi:golgin subfamily A member 4 [Trichonephila inaurata madagascariensis]|uniref:Golgin subfamily A member 4 n=1 Tax=Trichonephila inaurata madagascariensis TaxID=2747483 RepID=A0A8X6Y4V9_9ARAC|nr:golgin subfamily A member 4 [Trichonephila inaurata madagascariensis]
MFKRLRERIAEEAIKFPVGQLNSNSGKQLSDSENKSTGGNSTEDLITLSDSSAVVVPHTSSQQFSIGEDEDGSVSEHSTPQRKNESANGSVASGSRDYPAGTGSDLSFGQDYRPTKSNYIPQSDIESEREDPPTLNLEGISKDQLLSAIDVLKARAYKYKNKYVEVVKNYKELREEKLKIENTLIEQQDKALRRMAELREQCQLEQKAKAHLEANLRLLMEEKDSRICVLETQINLLKENPDSLKAVSETNAQHSDMSSGDALSDSKDHSALEEKFERYEHQLNQANKTITAQTDQISLLRKQNESLSQELEEKMKRLNEMEDEQGQLKSKHEFILQGMQSRLKELETQQEESVMSMAETKKNMHEELEFKEKQLVKAEEDAKQYQAAYETEKSKVLELQEQQDEKIKTLQHQLESTERMLEEEKQNLMQELARGKSAAITLVQQECAKKIAAVEEEWKIKLEDLQKEKGEVSEKKLYVVEQELKQQKQHVEELNTIIEQLEKENATLKSSLEKIESDFTLTSTKLEKLQAEYTDLEDLNQKQSLQYEERLKQELNDKLQQQQSESELRSLYESLKEQLNQNKNVINDMTQNKDSLCDQIHGLEKREKQLTDENESLKNEIKELVLKGKDLTVQLETFSDNDVHKNQEIQQLQELLNEVQLNFQTIEKELTECKKELVECKNEVLKLDSEKKELMSEVCLLTKNSEEMKNKLSITENEVAILNNILNESSKEFGFLKECLDEKLKVVEDLMKDYTSVDHCLISLEKQDHDLKSKINKYETDCSEVWNKVSKISKILKSMNLSKMNSGTNINADASLEESVNNSTLLLSKHSSLQENEKVDNSENNKELTFRKVPAMLLNYDLNSCDVKDLQKMIQELIDENQKLKESFELQNVEFAKYITELHESLNELKEERNNLSLVLQSVESHPQEIDPMVEKITKLTKPVKQENISYEQNKQLNCKLDVMELNNKIKSEIAALSAQTEIINHELCSLREQFKFAQLTYSEKVLQVNSKLMRRTELLLGLKEDLDTSIQNSEDLKCLLETTKKELIEKDDLLKVSEKNKEELESKLKNLKEKFVKKELSLKQIHNSQLSDLKDQTKGTIDKLNGEIQNLNAKITESEADFELKLSKVKEQYNQELNKTIEDRDQSKESINKLVEENHNLNVKLKECEIDYELKLSNIKEQYNEKFNKELENQDLLLQCKNNIKKIFETSKNFEFEFLSNLNKLDVHNSKICSLNSNFDGIALKLKEKDKSVANHQCKIIDLENQVKILVQENEYLKEMNSKINETSNLYEIAVNKLENETKQREMYEKEIIVLKEKHEFALKELEHIHHTKKVENEKLNSLLEETLEELKTLKIKNAEMHSSLQKTTNELNECKSDISLLAELREKYDLLLRDYKYSNENLEKEKNATSEALRAVSEWKSLYDMMLIKFKEFDGKCYENLEKVVLELNQYEMKFKSLETQFSKITALCKFQKTQISDLEIEVINLSEKNKTLAEQVQNQKDVAVSESKIENLEQNLNEVIDNRESLKLQLAEAETKFKAALEETDSKSDELKKTLSNLEETSLKLQTAEKRLGEETEKLLFMEKTIIQWEEKYNSLMNDFKRISDELKISTDDIKLSHNQLKEVNEQISLMVPKEKLISCEKTCADKLKEMESEMELLQETIKRLTNSVKEKELEIKAIQAEKEKLDVDHDESFKCMKDKLENAEKNYITQMDELKSRILLLEEEMCALKTEKSELLKDQEKLRKSEDAIKLELKLKEDELSKLQQKLEVTNKEQVSKIHNFQETMKDKENMILKLKVNIESLKKENSERNEELKRKISLLEEERENLMIQAQERVSNTEAKCREDIKALQEKNNKLLLENREIEKLNNKISQIDKQLCENQRIAESREIASHKEISLLKDQLAKAEEKFSEVEQKKQEIEAELSGKVRKLEEENSSLLGKTNHFESLKAEKEELNEKLKQAEQQVTSVKMLESERDKLRNENLKIVEELELLKSSQNNEALQEKIEALEISEKSVRSELEELKKSKEILENELAELRSLFEKEKSDLKSEKERLLKQIDLLEKMSSDPQSKASRDYIAVIRGECETAIKAKEEEMETKLKHLVRDFCIQMDVKDNDCDKMVSELMEKNQDLEERLVKEHRKEIAELRQNLFEKECALDEMRDNYEEVLQEKEKKLKELQSTIKKLSENSNNNDVALISTESSDWDDTWAVPEESVDNSSPNCNESCKDHVQQIESLQNEVTKCNSEIKELKVLLRLSPPESMVNCSRKDPSQSIPEPTEFEYLKNIIYEYMMGKEPVTLAKVIAAVLRFSDTQTQQVIRREEARHPMR